MSGGSMDYAYLRVEESINSFVTDTANRRAFKGHLEKVARAMKAIEWVDSGDSPKGSEDAAIMACINVSDVLASEIERAVEATKALEEAIKTATACQTQINPMILT